MSAPAATPLPVIFDADGLIPAVIQDATTGDVLMVGFMNAEALDLTRETGLVHFWSRTRQQLWQKGGTSGHVQHVRAIYVNCDENNLLVEVDQVGAVCHDGYPTCYYRRLEPDNSLTTVRDRWFDPQDVYGAAEGLAGLTARWWGAYAWLKDHDLGRASGTSRALRGDAPVLGRIADELRELAGVVEGTHVHANQRDDMVLEAGQVCYWTAVEAIRSGLTWDDVRPDRALDRTPDDAAMPAGTLVSLLRARADRLEGETTLSAADAHDILALVATACAAKAILPTDLILRDLEELRSRPYLAPYFEA